MNKVIFLLFMISLAACDQPRSRRYIERLDPETPLDNLGDGNSNPGTQPPNADATATPIPNADDNAIPQEYSHCKDKMVTNLTYQYEHPHIGNYNICKSSQNNDSYLIQIQNQIPNFSVCAIPTTSGGTNSSSTYVGEAKCFNVYESNKMVEINFIKNRPGYSSYSITGMMIMQDRPYYYPAPYNYQLNTPDAYLYCLNWLASYNDGRYCETFTYVGTQQSNYLYHMLN